MDIRPLLADADLRSLLAYWRRQNVQLIRTIPHRLHEGLLTKKSITFLKHPFDQRALRKLVAEEGKVAGWNLRRIVRDQANKAVRQLTRERQQQLGIESYVRRAAGDKKVRPQLEALNGTTQSWASPVPVVGFPGDSIQCCCVAQPVIPEILTA